MRATRVITRVTGVLRRGSPDERSRSGDETLISSSGSLLASRLVVAGLGWAGTVLIVRTLSPSDWGRFAFIFGFLGLLSVVTDLGVGRVVIAGLLDEDTDRQHLAGTYVVLRVLMGLLGYIVAIAFVSLAGYPVRVVWGTMVAGLVLVLATPSHGLSAVFQARRKLRTVALADTLGQLAQLALTVAIVTAGGTLVWLMVPAVAFEVVALAYKLRRIPTDLRPRYRIDWAIWRRLLKEAVPLAIGTILASAFHRVDVVMLSRLDTFRATGIYGITYKFADVVQYVSTALTMAALPALVGAWPKRMVTFHRTFSRALLLSFLAGALVLAEFILFARPVIALLYGDRYALAAHATTLVVAGEFVHFFSGLAFITLVATGRHRQYPLVALAGLALNVGLNLWLIPTRSFEGAALATLATEIVVAALLGSIVLRIRPTRPLPLAAMGRAVVAFATALAVGWGSEQVAPWPVAGVLSAATFVLVCHVTRVGGPGGLPALLRMDDTVEHGGQGSADVEPAPA